MVALLPVPLWWIVATPGSRVTSSTGTGNSVDIAQSFMSNQATVIQNGNDNLAGIEQGNYGHQATITQLGSANEAIIRQSLPTNDYTRLPSAAAIHQSGIGNSATIVQQ
jgi:hypothetical protein